MLLGKESLNGTSTQFKHDVQQTGHPCPDSSNIDISSQSNDNSSAFAHQQSSHVQHHPDQHHHVADQHTHSELPRSSHDQQTHEPASQHVERHQRDKQQVATSEPDNVEPDDTRPGHSPPSAYDDLESSKVPEDTLMKDPPLILDMDGKFNAEAISPPRSPSPPAVSTSPPSPSPASLDEQQVVVVFSEEEPISSAAVESDPASSRQSSPPVVTPSPPQSSSPVPDAVSVAKPQVERPVTMEPPYIPPQPPQPPARQLSGFERLIQETALAGIINQTMAASVNIDLAAKADAAEGVQGAAVSRVRVEKSVGRAKQSGTKARYVDKSSRRKTDKKKHKKPIDATGSEEDDNGESEQKKTHKDRPNARGPRRLSGKEISDGPGLREIRPPGKPGAVHGVQSSTPESFRDEQLQKQSMLKSSTVGTGQKSSRGIPNIETTSEVKSKNVTSATAESGTYQILNMSRVLPQPKKGILKSKSNSVSSLVEASGAGNGTKIAIDGASDGEGLKTNKSPAHAVSGNVHIARSVAESGSVALKPSGFDKDNVEIHPKDNSRPNQNETRAGPEEATNREQKYTKLSVLTSSSNRPQSRTAGKTTGEKEEVFHTPVQPPASSGSSSATYYTPEWDPSSFERITCVPEDHVLIGAVERKASALEDVDSQHRSERLMLSAREILLKMVKEEDVIPGRQLDTSDDPHVFSAANKETSSIQKKEEDKSLYKEDVLASLNGQKGLTSVDAEDDSNESGPDSKVSGTSTDHVELSLDDPLSVSDVRQSPIVAEDASIDMPESLETELDGEELDDSLGFDDLPQRVPESKEQGDGSSIEDFDDDDENYEIQSPLRAAGSNSESNSSSRESESSEEDDPTSAGSAKGTVIESSEIVGDPTAKYQHSHRRADDGIRGRNKRGLERAPSLEPRGRQSSPSAPEAMDPTTTPSRKSPFTRLVHKSKSFTNIQPRKSAVIPGLLGSMTGSGVFGTSPSHHYSVSVDHLAGGQVPSALDSVSAGGQSSFSSSGNIPPTLDDDEGRQRAWESGNIDYKGVDSFDNIQKHLEWVMNCNKDADAAK